MTRTKKFFEEFLKESWRAENAAAFRKLRAYVLDHSLLRMLGFAYQGHEKWRGKRRDWYSFFGRKLGITMSMRSWGGFMAALMNDELGERKYDYIDFAWASPKTKGKNKVKEMKCVICGSKDIFETTEVLAGGIRAKAWKCRKCGETLLEPKAAQKALLLNKLRRGRGECSNCGQPLGDHCEGCCIDVTAGVYKGKFCGKKGNGESSSRSQTWEELKKPLRSARKKIREDEVVDKIHEMPKAKK